MVSVKLWAAFSQTAELMSMQLASYISQHFRCFRDEATMNAADCNVMQTNDKLMCCWAVSDLTILRCSYPQLSMTPIPLVNHLSL